MAWLRQTWTLTKKNLLIVFWRHWISTTLRAFVLPIVYMFFISYAKNFFVPPSQFGVGTATPIRSFPDALASSHAGRHIVAFVNNGFSDGAIGTVINDLVQVVHTVPNRNTSIITSRDQLDTVCPSTLNGVTPCYAAVEFHSSPQQPVEGGRWNYTLYGDGALAAKIFVDQTDNDQEIYALPIQRAVDERILASEGNSLPATSYEYPYTIQTQAERDATITRLYQGTVLLILAVAFFLGMVGVAYQLVGHMATERETEITPLIETMMPNRRRWVPQAVRLLSLHISFDIIYLPAWIIMGAIVKGLVFPQSSTGLLIGLHIIAGLALTSFSIFFGGFFRKAQLSGISTVIIFCVLAIIAQTALGENPPAADVGVLSLLFPPMTYVFFLMYIAGFQQDVRAAILSQPSPDVIGGVTGQTLFILFAVQILVYPILGALVERWLWGTASRQRKLVKTGLGAPSVKLTGFSKHYTPGRVKSFFLCTKTRRQKRKVVAVDDLNLQILQGQIYVLVGANGSGKTTTLGAIAGLNQVIRGSIELDGSGGLGYCPQKNVLWDELTVEEHVSLFDQLKTERTTDSKSTVRKLIADCDLAAKQSAKAATLSGGQKRKLQLAMMFTGGSKVCCVDEVSSGIDPLARRKIWDILLAERGHRTIILTTHFLDEADILSDHIAVLSKGKLKAEGSAVELKYQFRSGYEVFVEDSVHLAEPEFQTLKHRADYDHTVYYLPDSATTSRFLAGLERQGIKNYRVQSPTIEDVFMSLSDEVREATASDNAASPPSTSSRDTQEIKPIRSTNTDTPSFHRAQEQLNLSTGKGNSFLREVWVLFRKRVTILRSNYFPYLAALLVPIVAAGCVTLFFKPRFDPLGCVPTTSYGSDEDNWTLKDLPDLDLLYGPASRVPIAQINKTYLNFSKNDVHLVNSAVQLNTYIDKHYHNVTPGGFFLGDNGPVIAYVGNYNVYPGVIVQNIVNSILGGTLIETAYKSFEIPWAPNTGKTLQLILYFGLAISAYPGFFGLYTTAERLRKVRALHYSNGVRSSPLWIAYALFDFVFVMIISIVVVVIFTTQWGGWYYPGYLFVVLFLYGLTSAAYSYAISLFAPSQLALFAWSAGSQCILFLIYFIVYLVIITYAPVNQINHYITVAHFTIGLITPAGNFLRAMLLTLNEFSILCEGKTRVDKPSAFWVYGGPITYLIVQFVLLILFVIWWDSGGRIALKRKKQHLSDTELEKGDETTETYKGAEETIRNVRTNDGLRVSNLTKKFGHNTAVDHVTFDIAKGETYALLGPNGAGKSTTISLIRGDLRPTRKGGDVLIEGDSIIHHRRAARNHLGVCPQFDAMDQMTCIEHLRFYARARGVPNVEQNVRECMNAVGLNQYAKRAAGKLSGGNKRKLSLAIALMGNPSVLLLDEPSSGMDAAAKRTMWSVLGSVAAGRALLITTHSMEEADALAHRAGIMASKMLAQGNTTQLRKTWADMHYVHMIHKDAPHTEPQEMERIKSLVQRWIPGADVEPRTWSGQLRFSVPNASSRLAAAPTVNESEKLKGVEFAVEKLGSANSIHEDGITSVKTGGATIATLFDLLELHKSELNFSYYSVAPATLDQVFLRVVMHHNVQEENYHNHASSAEEKESKRGPLWKIRHLGRG